MFLKKVDGPRSVKLPDGTFMTRADLPAPDTKRWVASRKATVVKAVQYGLLTVEQAMDRYALSEEELSHWLRAATEHGEEALKTTRIQQFRQP
jgi:hypothetical protein